MKIKVALNYFTKNKKPLIKVELNVSLTCRGNSPVYDCDHVVGQVQIVPLGSHVYRSPH